jgi:hypothetical protein
VRYNFAQFIIFFLHFCLYNSSVSAANLPGCAMPDRGIYSNSKVSFSFSSWISPPNSGGIKYLFGKCIASNSRQYFKALWAPTSLRGTVEYDRPLYSELPFLSDRSKEIDSVINFGVRTIYEDELKTKLVVNENEIIDDLNDGARQKIRSDENPTRSLIRRAVSRELDQSKIDEISMLTSKTGINISHPMMSQPFYVEFEVSSAIPGRDGNYLYNSNISISAVINSSESDSNIMYALTVEPIRIFPSNPFLIYNLYSRNRYIYFSELVGGGRISLPLLPISMSTFDLKVEEFQLRLGGETIGTFAAAIYTDTGSPFR